MPEQREIDQQLSLLNIHRRTLGHLLRQLGILSGGYITPGQNHGIDEARANIARIKNNLREWGVPVENVEGDENPPELPTIARVIEDERIILAQRLEVALAQGVGTVPPEKLAEYVNAIRNVKEVRKLLESLN
jgi:hypothetical protein